MPYSFTKIEEDKSQTISIIFSVLLVFYFVIALVLYTTIKNISVASKIVGTKTAYHFVSVSVKEAILIFLIAGLVGGFHWLFSTNRLIDRLLALLGAEPLNPEDRYHKKAQNIIDEVSVATGGESFEGVVIPSMAMNAFALADFDGRKVIGVTEGLLSRLSRGQLEAVIGHEAAHLVTGDCLAATVSTSIFELINALLVGVQKMFFPERGQRVRVSSRMGAVYVGMIFVYMILCSSRVMAFLIRMCISRQREYRADAIAVRLTRDPLSLAEALYAIRFYWNSPNLHANELGTIFITDPQRADGNESEDLWSNLFQTHPPMRNRIGVLLDIAHADMKTLKEEVIRKGHRPRIDAPTLFSAQPDQGTQWMLCREGQWQGPFNLTKMATLDWLRPDVWVNRLDDHKIKQAGDIPEINSILSQTVSGGSALSCPKCHVPLQPLFYEGTQVHQCSFCQGILAQENDVQRIIIRPEVGFSERIERMADKIEEGMKEWKSQKINRSADSLYSCPRCQKETIKMPRMFYTAVYQVVIDKCIFCRSLWFDRDELELLQCLVERHTEKPNR